MTPIYLHPTHAFILCSHHPCLMLKAFSFLVLLFLSFHNLTSYTMHNHGFASSHHCTTRFIHIFISLHYMFHTPYVLSRFFTSSHCYTTLYHDSTSSHSIMLHQPCYNIFLNVYVCFASLCFFLQSYCFVLFCSFLLVCGDHCPRIGGLSPFEGSFFPLGFIVIALLLCLFASLCFFCKVHVVVFFCFVAFTLCMTTIVLLWEVCSLSKVVFS